jgi:hypothetical protein
VCVSGYAARGVAMEDAAVDVARPVYDLGQYCKLYVFGEEG